MPDALIRLLNGFPAGPGVYIYKDASDVIVYIGKAKNLKKRARWYIQNVGKDVKVDSIFEAATSVECTVTESELEALFLEAKLVQMHQPKFNVLLKSGQPFLYLFISATPLPILSIVRNKKKKGSYFGPFLNSSAARRVYDFLIKTFRLKLCKTKCENGCLFYHLGICAGSCRSDFDLAAYVQRLELAKHMLTHGHKVTLQYLKKQIAEHNKLREYERSRELHAYMKAFENVFEELEIGRENLVHVEAGRDMWVVSADKTALYVLREREGALKKRHVFHTLLAEYLFSDAEQIQEYFLSFYSTYSPPSIILTSFDFGKETSLYESFLQQWHQRGRAPTITCPEGGHEAALMRLATVYVQQLEEKRQTYGQALKIFLHLKKAPQTIDCFDISHKQGMFMVGSCVRFSHGQMDKNKIRVFKIKTLEHQDDYAALREVVSRRYKDGLDLPDLIVIDGGKGQLNTVLPFVFDTPCVGLAKREETIFSVDLPQGKKLNPQSYVGQILIALRDYAHHIAISFHRNQESKQWDE